MTDLVQMIDSTRFNLPAPTSWIPYTKGEDVPTGCVLVALVSQEIEEGEILRSPVICDFNAELKTFIDADQRAIEAMGTVTDYHVLHFPDGELLYI